MTWTTRPRSRTGRTAYIRAGSGPRLVLIHGVGLRAEAWAGQLPDLAGSFEVLAPDLAGHGESDGFAEEPTLQAFSDRLAGLLNRDTVLVGHSMGAMIALDLAFRNPDAVRGVVALNAIYRRTTAAGEAVRQRAGQLDGVHGPDPEPTLARWFGDRASPERNACAGWLRSVDPESYRHAYRVFASEDGPSDAGLRSLNCPALFMTGREEPNSTPAMSEAMAALAADGRCRVLAGAAHMMPMTHAAEVTAAIQAFATESLT
ncbi:alpha/beta fold hydrolase [Labrenzia sp. VG12]|uniref:alpha/beta fold hydrolase n=1 Tax=Labrenzia sp. VG12 TaxID=2021862 RepID=UPI000B8BFE85|nr:alpha/beta hydrolase [Labrenzia sp. VG12]ASP34570.1 alpha/beta hydrolase [Labrenzia sp. VG12]